MKDIRCYATHTETGEIFWISEEKALPLKNGEIVRTVQVIPESKNYYEHYKGNIYNVFGTSENSITGEKLVIYKALEDTKNEKIWARPLNMFMENVLIDNVYQPRFKKTEL